MKKTLWPDLPVDSPVWDLPWEQAQERFEREYFQRRLAGRRGTLTELARDLGLARPNLYLKMKKLGLS